MPQFVSVLVSAADGFPDGAYECWLAPQVTSGEGCRCAAGPEDHGPGVQTHRLVVPHSNDGCVLVSPPGRPLYGTCSCGHGDHVSGTCNIYLARKTQSNGVTGNMMMMT